MISTISMIHLGKTFGNLMIDVGPGNAKLRARQRRTVELATGADAERARSKLLEAGNDIRRALR